LGSLSIYLYQAATKKMKVSELIIYIYLKNLEKNITPTPNPEITPQPQSNIVITYFKNIYIVQKM
jgi:hypothetical protein